MNHLSRFFFYMPMLKQAKEFRQHKIFSLTIGKGPISLNIELAQN